MAEDTADELTRMGELWIPSHERLLIARAGVTDNLPDLGVRQIKEAVTRCRTKRRAIDVGAHIGATAVTLGRYFEQVDAFEPNPRTYAILHKNCKDRSNIELHNAALSDIEGQMKFEDALWHSQLGRKHSGQQQLNDPKVSEPVKDIVIGPATSEILTVQSARLDSYGFDDVSFIKIDVEGIELAVLKGAIETIKRCNPVLLVEQAGNEARWYGAPKDEATRFLFDMGMTTAPFPFKKDRLFIWHD